MRPLKVKAMVRWNIGGARIGRFFRESAFGLAGSRKIVCRWFVAFLRCSMCFDNMLLPRYSSGTL